MAIEITLHLSTCAIAIPKAGWHLAKLWANPSKLVIGQRILTSNFKTILQLMKSIG